MKFSSAVIAAAAAVPAFAARHGEELAEEMGPVSFLWPADREWDADYDNVAPCGSTAGPGDRADFPLTGGFVSLVAQQKAYYISLKISHKSDPKSMDDFEEFYYGNLSSEVDYGHTCFYVPDQDSDVKVGDVATLQVEYFADDTKDDVEMNESFYACADIKFVSESVFDSTEEALGCFNATSQSGDEEYYEEKSDKVPSTTTVTSESVSTTTASNTSPASTETPDGAVAHAVSYGFVGAAGLLAALL